MNTSVDFNLTSGCTQARVLPPGFDQVKVALFCIIIILSLLGNTCVVLVIYHNKQMQTVTNFLICNSSFADLLITCLPTVLEVVDIEKHHGRWPLGLFMCKFVYLSVYLSVGASIITLEVITIERYLAVMHPHKRYLKTTQLRALIPLIWIVAFLFACPTLWAQKVVNLQEFGNVCTERWSYPFDPEKSPKHYTVVLFLCLYAVPLVIMSVLYSILGKRLWQSSFKNEGAANEQAADVTVYTNKLVANGSASQTDINPSGPADQNGDVGSPTHLVNKSTLSSENTAAVTFTNLTDKDSSLKAKANIYTKIASSRRPGDARKRRVVKMLAALVIVFALCWLPVFVLQFVLFFDPFYVQCPESMPSWVGSFAFLMQYSNSAINPFLYFIFSRSYRKGFRSAFCTGSKQRKIFSWMESRTQ